MHRVSRAGVCPHSTAHSDRPQCRKLCHLQSSPGINSNRRDSMCVCCLQAWKEQLYPLLKQHLAEHVDSSIWYLVLYHEAAVANLLEVG